MMRSIQDYLIKINSRIHIYDIVSLFLLVLMLGAFSLYLHETRAHNDKGITISYKDSPNSQTVVSKQTESRPFGSASGTTYTYTWCSGSSRTLARNRIYFASEDEAKRSGRTLSKLCSK